MILGNARLAFRISPATKDGSTHSCHNPGLPLERGAVVIEGKQIAWIGSEQDLPDTFHSHERIDLEGRLVTPGLIDCHTHLVFGGHRAIEFEQRLLGATYEEIAKKGGGILSTVKATRQASEEELLSEALKRVDHLIDEGVCSIEIKSGYGLEIDTELKMLKVARRIARERPIRVFTSYLAMHAVPPEYRGRTDDYVDQVGIPGLHEAHRAGLVDAVDGFCERIAFSVDQCDRLFAEAKSLGLPVKLHAEQLTRLGGTQLAARYRALSADHLEYANEEDARAMSDAGTIAVLLPGAFYTLRENQLPPLQALRAHGVPMAVATDCNPGSSPLTSLLLAMNMACTLFRMTPEETLHGTTQWAARALGLNDCGNLAPGLRADLAIWEVEHPSELSYRIGFRPLWKRIFEGEIEC